MFKKLSIVFFLSAVMLILSGCYTQFGTPATETEVYAEGYDESYGYYDEDSAYVDEPVYLIRHYYTYGYPYDFVFSYWDPWWITPRWGFYVGINWGYPYWAYPPYYYPYYCYFNPYYAGWYYDPYYYGSYYGYVYPQNFERREFGRRSQFSAIRVASRNNNTRNGGGVPGKESFRTGYTARQASPGYVPLRGGNSAVKSSGQEGNGSRSNVSQGVRKGDKAKGSTVNRRSGQRSDVKSPKPGSKSNSGKTTYKPKQRKSTTSKGNSPSYRQGNSRSSGSSYRGSSGRSGSRSSGTRSSSSGSRSSSGSSKSGKRR